MLPIEFRVAGFKPNEVALQYIRNIFSPAMAKLGLTEKDVRRVIIADEDQYGPTIKEIAPREGYTNDGVYVGAGKAVPHFANEQYAGSTLILSDAVIEAFIPQPDRDQAIIETFQYAPFHELGHCVDYRKRPEQHFQEVQPVCKSHIQHCLEANCPVILSEYAACFFSAQYLSPAAFRFTVDSAKDNLAQYFRRIETQQASYSGGITDIRKVRDAAMIAFWRGQLEFSKIFAFLNGNRSLVPYFDMHSHWPGKSRNAARFMQEFAGKLCDGWRSYPECSDLFFKASHETWFAITEAEGYKFEQRGQDDYLNGSPLTP